MIETDNNIRFEQEGILGVGNRGTFILFLICKVEPSEIEISKMKFQGNKKLIQWMSQHAGSVAQSQNVQNSNHMTVLCHCAFSKGFALSVC